MIRYQETNLVDMTLDGGATIYDQIIDGMEKSGYKLESFRVSTDPEYIGSLGEFLDGIEDEDDVPAFTRIKMRFKDLEPPPVESSDTAAQKRRAPLDAEFEAARLDAAAAAAAANSYSVKPEGAEEDDIAEE